MKGGKVENQPPTLELEPATCCVCGSNQGRVCLSGHDVEFRTCTNHFTFLQCEACEHVYLSPRPRADEMDAIYANYLTTNRESAYRPSPVVAWIKDVIFDKHRLRHVLGALRDGSHVLDIGAGAGRLLKLLKRLSGTDVRLWANDISFDDATRIALSESGISVLEGPVASCVAPVRFDAITSIHVIEHVLDPVETFHWIGEHLNPGGILYMETPDAETILRRIFKDDWGHTHFPRHINLFNKRHLAQMARNAGLRVVRHANTTSAPAWNMSIRNRLGMDALQTYRSPLEVFNYSNPVTLGFFTVVDLMLLGLGVPTSTQFLVATK